MKTPQNILHSLYLIGCKNVVNLTSIVVAATIVSVSPAIAQETPKINPDVLEYVEHVKSNPTWVSGNSMYVRNNEPKSGIYIRSIYRDFSPSERRPNSIVDKVDTISVDYANYSTCCVKLDMSNLDENEKDEFLENVRKCNKYFLEQAFL